MRTTTVAGLAHLLWHAGMSHEDAKDAALRLAAEGHYATRGLADAPAFVVTERLLRSAGVPDEEAAALAIALGQQGYRIVAQRRGRYFTWAASPS